MALVLLSTLPSGCSQKSQPVKGNRTVGPQASAASGATADTGETPAPTHPALAAAEESRTTDPDEIPEEKLSPEERSNLGAIRAKIAADPRIHSGIHVAIVRPSFGSAKQGEIKLTGRVANEDEEIAAWNDARSLYDGGVSDMLAATRNQETEAVAAADVKPEKWSGDDAGKSVIPLCKGLTVVTAIASQGDYESIKTIESATDDEVRIKYSADVGPPWWTVGAAQLRCDPGERFCELKHVTTLRTVLRRDLESAHRYDQIFVPSVPEIPQTVPNSTAIGASAAVLRELKARGEAEFNICQAAFDEPVIDSSGHPKVIPGGCESFSDSLTIRRVGNKPIPVRVLVDGTPTDLPAVQARGRTSSGDREELLFLDDERNPLTLAFRLGIGKIRALDPGTRQLCEAAKTGKSFTLTGPVSCDLPDGGDENTLRVIKISTRCRQDERAPAAGATEVNGTGSSSSGGANALEKALAEHGSVDVYSIYFAFNSASIREESEPTLEDVAEVMRRHPDWKLRVSGHTDAVGGDDFNVDLSRRRAAAVKDALVTRYRVKGDRLTTSGLGRSQPKDTNDTLEGRANNRRVELVKVS